MVMVMTMPVMIRPERLSTRGDRYHFIGAESGFESVEGKLGASNVAQLVSFRG